MQIDFEFFGDCREPILYSSLEEWSSNLRIVLEWSPFASEEELLLQVLFNILNSFLHSLHLYSTKLDIFFVVFFK